MEFLRSQRPSFDNWQKFYTQFGINSVFNVKASEAGISSSVFNEFFVSGFVDWFGVANKTSYYNAKEVKDPYFAEYLKKENIPEPTSYRKTSRANVNFLRAAYRSAAKYDRAQFPIDELAWEKSYKFMSDHFWRMRGSDVLGVDDVWAEMNKQSSPGFPWNLKYKTKSECSDMLKSVADLVWDQMEYKDFGLTYVPIWNSAVKVELRPREKFTCYGGEVDKLRTFTASPGELSIIANRLFLDQNNKFYDSAGYCWSEVGASKYYGGFDRMYSRLNRFKNAYALDETNFDASLLRRLLYGCRNFRWDCLAEKWKVSSIKARLYHVYENIVNSVIVLDSGDLVRKETGNPSGSSNTVVDNTLCLYRLFAYAYIILAQRFGIEPTLKHFEENVEALLYGDDNTFSTSDALVSWFNARTICEVWSNLGVITNPSEGICDARLPIDSTSYLINLLVLRMLFCPVQKRIEYCALYCINPQSVI